MKRTRNKARTENFELVIDGGAVEVKATPYLVNGEVTRFRVSYNESPVYIFAVDEHNHRASMIDGKDKMPQNIEIAIANKLVQVERRHAA
jgi:hypothetical protein